MSRLSTSCRSLLQRATLAAFGLLWLGVLAACQDNVVTILDADLRRGDATSTAADVGVSGDVTHETADAEPDAAE